MNLNLHKFTYGSINRVEDNSGRKYLDTLGNRISSVTTILGKSRDQSHLQEWRDRIGPAAADQITQESAALGTMMHTHLEQHIRGGDRPGGTNVGRVLARRMADAIIQQGLSGVDEVWGIEVPLIYSTLWAGTTDLVGVYRDQPSVMDFKTTIRPKKLDRVQDYFLQLTAYIMAHNLTHGTDIRQGVIFMCSRDLTYQEFVLNSEDFERYQMEWCRRVEKFYNEHVFCS
jgi:genome maintenance exonuclease 1